MLNGGKKWLLFLSSIQSTKFCELNVGYFFYFYCYNVHVVELLNYYTNHCTYIKFTKFTH